MQQVGRSGLVNNSFIHVSARASSAVNSATTTANGASAQTAPHIQSLASWTTHLQDVSRYDQEAVLERCRSDVEELDKPTCHGNVTEDAVECCVDQLLRE